MSQICGAFNSDFPSYICALPVHGPGHAHSDGKGVSWTEADRTYVPDERAVQIQEVLYPERISAGSSARAALRAEEDPNPGAVQ